MSNGMQRYIELVFEYGLQYGLKLIFALLIFFIGKRVAKVITNTVVKLMQKNKVDVELQGFVESLLYWGLFIVVCVAALGQLGVQTASFVSVIQIFTTKLKTADNKLVIIPNARVMDGNIVNYSATGTRRVDMMFGIGYEDDIDQAREIIKTVIDADDRILQDRDTQIAVMELADSSVNFVVRPWVKSDDYWSVYTSLNETIKKEFDDQGISIPYPQRTVHTMSNAVD